MVYLMIQKTSFEKVCLVTGAASGIGLAIAQSLKAQGHLVVLSDVNKEQGEIEAKKISADFMMADLAKQEDCKNLIEQVIKHHGRIDILVNNAGFQHVSPIAEFPEDTWNTMIQVMLTAPFLLTKYAWPSMQSNGWGRIINIASVHAQVASLYKVAYISAKHGLIGLTKTAALEGAEHGINVNAICPAYVRTPLVDKQIKAQAKHLNLDEDQVIKQVMLKNAAIKRLINPEEIGQMVVYLCSNAATSVTGSSWNIDLGWTAQ